MPGEADHRAVAVAAANEALRLIKKTSKTQKHNEEPVYQSIRGHEYANKSLNCLLAASSPTLAQIGAAGGGFQVVPGWFCAPLFVQEDQGEARGWGEVHSLRALWSSAGRGWGASRGEGQPQQLLRHHNQK